MLKCPKCGYDQSYVINSRSKDGGIRRRRECNGCGYRYTTYEACEDIVTKRAIMRELIPILSRNIKDAVTKSFRELKDL